MARMIKPVVPWKYAHFLAILDNKIIYSAKLIAAIGEALGFFGYVPKQERDVIRQRVTHFLHNLAWEKLPNNVSGMVALPKGLPERGWTGGRWKALLTNLSWDYAKAKVRMYGFRAGDSLPEFRHQKFIPKPKWVARPVLPTAEQIKVVRFRQAERDRQRRILSTKRAMVVQAMLG